MYTIDEDGTRLSGSTPRWPMPRAAAVADAADGGGFGGGERAPWARDGRSIYFLQGGGIYTLAVSRRCAATDTAATATAGRGGRGGRGGATGAAARCDRHRTAGAAPRRIPFSVRMEIDIPAERRQVFEEAWRVMKNRFYDPKMHGVNWAAAKDKYESLLPHIADTEELHNLIMEMIGDMNASHTGISGGGRLPGQASSPKSACRPAIPASIWSPMPRGFYKVAYIYRKGPADHDYVKLAAGNFILAVNGQGTEDQRELLEAFNILPGRKFEFLVNSKPATEGAWTVVSIRSPPPRRSNLEYDRWVEDRKADGGQTDPTARSAICTSRPWTPPRLPNSSATCWRTRTRRR